MGELTGADGRTRIHIWPTRVGYRSSLGPTGIRAGERRTAGQALDVVWGEIDPEAAAKLGVVVIVEPVPIDADVPRTSGGRSTHG